MKSAAFIGALDSGKSSLVTALLRACRAVPTERWAQAERDARATGRPSHAAAFVGDTRKEERERGVTMVAKLHTAELGEAGLWTLIDTPGHRARCVPVVRALGIADVAVLVVDASRPDGRRVRELLLQAKAMGVRSVVVALNKMDLLLWEPNDTEDRVRDWAARVEFPATALRFAPCCAFDGSTPPAAHGVSRAAYDGAASVLEQLCSIPVPPPPAPLAARPLRALVFAVHRSAVAVVRVAQGTLRAADVPSLERAHEAVSEAAPGDVVGVGATVLRRGDVLGLEPAARFTAQLVVVGGLQMRPGMVLTFCVGTGAAPCRLLSVGADGVVEAEPMRPLCVAADCRRLRRIVVQHHGLTRAVGVVVSASGRAGVKSAAKRS